AILAAMLLPALAKAKAKGQSIACLNNVRQLHVAWHTYILDHNDTMPPHIPAPAAGGLSQALPGSWVVGNAQTDTTSSNIQRGVLYSYASSQAVYRCPADKSTVTGSPGIPHTRSYTRDDLLNVDPTLWGVTPQDLKPYNKTKYSQLSNPAQIF